MFHPPDPRAINEVVEATGRGPLRGVLPRLGGRWNMDHPLRVDGAAVVEFVKKIGFEPDRMSSLQIRSSSAVIIEFLIDEAGHKFAAGSEGAATRTLVLPVDWPQE